MVEDIQLKFANLTKHTTVTVPNNGYIVLRFLANNPGIWLFHCHTFSHLFEGQALLLDVTDKGIPPGWFTYKVTLTIITLFSTG